MKRVLMLCYYYPPQGGVGCVRSVGFSRHLAAHGWEPTVLSVANPFRPMMPVTGEEPPAGVRVRYARNWCNYPVLAEAALRRLGVPEQVLVPDPWVGWIPGAILAGRGLLDDQKFDAVYVSCPPFSAAVAAKYLARRSDLPLVVDLRDAWTQNPYAGRYLAGCLEARDRRLEREVLGAAAAVVCATAGIRDDYRRALPEIADRFVCVPNGFEPRPPAPPPRNDRFTIIYTGFFYGVQSPAPLFAAIAGLEDLRLRFAWAGRDAPWVRNLARDAGVSHLIDYLGMLPKAGADALLGTADLLYLAIGETRGPNTAMTNKIYPYIGSGVPILAHVPEGPAAEMIRRYSPESTVITSTGDERVAETVAAIRAAHARRARGDPVRERPETAAFAAQYSHAATARQLAGILDEARVHHRPSQET